MGGLRLCAACPQTSGLCPSCSLCVEDTKRSDCSRPGHPGSFPVQSKSRLVACGQAVGGGVGGGGHTAVFVAGQPPGMQIWEDEAMPVQQSWSTDLCPPRPSHPARNPAREGQAVSITAPLPSPPQGTRGYGLPPTKQERGRCHHVLLSLPQSVWGVQSVHLQRGGSAECLPDRLRAGWAWGWWGAGQQAHSLQES